MSALVIVLPVINKKDDMTLVQARLNRADYGHLVRIAAAWELTVEQAAGAALAGVLDALRPPVRKRKRGKVRKRA